LSEEKISATSMRAHLSTGYARLDEVLKGGFLAGSSVILSAAPGDEVILLLRAFLQANNEESLFICRSLSSVETVVSEKSEKVKSIVCSDKTFSPARNILPSKGIDNLTELSLQLSEAISSIQPKRVVIEILPDILLRHKALQTRRWLTELLERLRTKNVTTLAVINPHMHADEEVQAVLSLFDGSLELVEKDATKSLLIKWMHGIDIAEKELPLAELLVDYAPIDELSIPAVAFREPRWLTPLVDRADELSKLRIAFQEAVNKKSSVVGVHGEAGVGKTRLIRELVTHAQSKGATVLAGRVSEEDASYGPWVEVAREYISQAPSEVLRRMLGPHVSDFAKLVPDITAKVGTVPPPKPLDEQQDRLRLFESITHFLISISKDSPLVIVFDDLQWADQATLDLLEYFVKSTGNLPILVACTYRTEDVGPDTSLHKMLGKLNRERLLETLTIKNLTKDDTVSLIEQIFGQKQVSTEFTDLIYHTTGGNPFFVEEVLRSLVDDGTIYRTEKGWDRKPIDEVTVPESVKSTLRSRLSKLEPDTLGTLVWGAVMGPEFDFDVLLSVSQSNEDQLVQRLEAVISHGLVAEVPHEKSKFRFVDNRIRELLLDDLIQIKRARYHLKIAEAMEKLYAGKFERHAEAIANHFSEGGDTERCVKFSIIAGDLNKSIHAYEPAIRDYRRAVELLDLEGGREGEKAGLLEKLGACYAFAGQLQNSTQSYERALSIFEKTHDNTACARTCREIAEAVIFVKAESGVVEATTILKRGLNYLQGEPDSSEAASTYSSLAWNHAIMDQFDEANIWAEKALEVGKKTNNIRAVAEALSIQGSFLTDTGKIDEGLPLWQQAYDLAIQHEEYLVARNCIFNLSVYTYPRDIGKAREMALKSIELARSTNIMSSEARGLWWLSVLDWLRGEWTTASEEFQTANAIMERLGIGIDVTTVEVDGWKGWYALSIGELEKAEGILKEAQRLSEKVPKITLVVTINLASGLLKLEQGREQEAIAIFEKSVDMFKNWEFTTEPLLHIETLLHLSRLYCGRRESEKAEKTAAWARRLAETLKSDAGLAMAYQAEANVLLANGDRKRAFDSLAKCQTLWDKAGWPYYKAKALVDSADILAQTDTDESKRRLREAVEVFRRLGAKRDLEKAETKLTAHA
jgi:tetratricopeptide (TPR) repeat protein/KaiC/GvpD/RAD55 family RecA-like ATPase